MEIFCRDAGRRALLSSFFLRLIIAHIQRIIAFFVHIKKCI